jgi:tellurite resistance protein
MLDPIKLAHFRNLISLSAADGKIEELERVALSKIAYENGIPLDRLNLMLDRANEYQYLIPQDTSDKEKQLDDMIRLALVDGEFSPAERELINTVSERLGFSKPALDRLIELVLAEN